jgi:hypothetical protein
MKDIRSHALLNATWMVGCLVGAVENYGQCICASAALAPT